MSCVCGSGRPVVPLRDARGVVVADCCDLCLGDALAAHAAAVFAVVDCLDDDDFDFAASARGACCRDDLPWGRVCPGNNESGG